MTPEKLLTILETALTPFVLKEQKGYISIASDPWNCLELLAEAKPGMGVVLHYAGDTNPSDQAQAPMADVSLEISVALNPGLTATPDKKLVHSKPGTPSLQALVHKVRNIVQQIDFPPAETSIIPHYKGCETVTLPEGLPLRVYKLTFNLTTNLND